MRISDWSSDVCSSDLYDRPRARREIDRAKADPEARAVIARWVAEQSSKPATGNTSDLSASSSHDCCSGETSGSLCRACRTWPRHGREQGPCADVEGPRRSEEHTSELQSLMRTSYAVFCLKKKK